MASLLDIIRHTDDVLRLLDELCCSDTQCLRGSQQQAKRGLPLAPLQFAVVGTVDVRSQRELVLSDSEPLSEGSNRLPKRLGRTRVEGRCPAVPWLS